MNRKTKLISDTMGALLIKQAAHELKNFVLYNNFANYFELEAIVPLAEYFSKRAAEEKAHHDWILSYMNDADCRMMYPAIEQNKEQAVESLIDPFVFTVDREIETTQLLYKIHEQAVAERDLMTMIWLQEHLIKEQIEEENTSRVARAIMERDGDILIKAEAVLNLLAGY